jgi:exonuclease VII small subunit
MSFESALDSLEEIVAPANSGDQLNLTGGESLEGKDKLRN